MKKSKIKNTFIYLNLYKWLKINKHRFPIEPYVGKINDSSFELKFRNVDYIKVIFKDYGDVEVWATNEDYKDSDETIPLLKEFVDILYEFDLREKKLNKGHLCEVCIPHTYTKNLGSIWEMHVYEPMLKWVEINITPENHLCIYETENKDVMWIKIHKSSELEKDKDFQYRIVTTPIVKINSSL